MCMGMCIGVYGVGFWTNLPVVILERVVVRVVLQVLRIRSSVPQE